MTFGQSGASLLFEHQRFTRFERQHRNAGRGAGFEGLRTEAGDVEAHIVIGLGDFDRDRAAVFACQLAATREALVRAFKSFNRQYGAVFYDNDLADFQP